MKSRRRTVFEHSSARSPLSSAARSRQLAAIYRPLARRWRSYGGDPDSRRAHDKEAQGREFQRRTSPNRLTPSSLAEMGTRHFGWLYCPLGNPVRDGGGYSGGRDEIRSVDIEDGAVSTLFQIDTFPMLKSSAGGFRPLKKETTRMYNVNGRDASWLCSHPGNFECAKQRTQI